MTCEWSGCTNAGTTYVLSEARCDDHSGEPTTEAGKSLADGEEDGLTELIVAIEQQAKQQERERIDTILRGMVSEYRGRVPTATAAIGQARRRISGDE